MIIDFLARRKAAVAANKIAGTHVAGNVFARILELPTAIARRAANRAFKNDNRVHPAVSATPILTRAPDRDIKLLTNRMSDIRDGGS